MKVDFSKYHYSPVIRFPKGARLEVYDFTQGYDPDRITSTPYGVGRYNEKRVGMYTTALFTGERNIHMGIDLAAPLGTEVCAFYPGTIFKFAYNKAPGDYGYTLVTKHLLDGVDLFALYGHLSARSLDGKSEGQPITAGQVIAWIGDRNENGGWNPHLHFQLSWVRPEGADLPGAVSENDREQALKIYPDPRLVLGPLY